MLLTIEDNAIKINVFLGLGRLFSFVTNKCKYEIANSNKSLRLTKFNKALRI